MGGGAPPLPPLDIKAFQTPISSYKKSKKQAPSNFVKNVDDIPKVLVHPTSAQPFVIRLTENGLIG